jgi:hypothetical protein
MNVSSVSPQNAIVPFLSVYVSLPTVALPENPTEMSVQELVDVAKVYVKLNSSTWNCEPSPANSAPSTLRVIEYAPGGG